MTERDELAEPSEPSKPSAPAEPPAPVEDDPWAKTSWEGHAQWQLERTLSATPEQRLAWLEAAIRLAHAAGAIRRSEVELAVPSRSRGTRS